MNKIYDKLLLLIAVLALAGGAYLYTQAASDAKSPSAVSETPANHPYQPEPVPESGEVEANWPEASEQSTGWLYDVFTPPQIFIDADGRFSIVPITPPPPPVPFGVYLAEIRRNLYRLQLEGYIEEDPSDALKSLLLFVNEEAQSQVRARPGDVKAEHKFEVKDFTIERVMTPDGGIEKVATATIYDQRRDETIELVHSEQRFDSGITVVLRSREDASVDIELTEAPTEFQTPSGIYTLQEINLEESSVTVEKQATEGREAETSVLFVESKDPADNQRSSPSEKRKEDASDESLDVFDSLF